MSDTRLPLREGWWGGLIIEFGPDVAAEEANELLAALSKHLNAQGKVPVRKAMWYGPNQEGLRDA